MPAPADRLQPILPRLKARMVLAGVPTGRKLAARAKQPSHSYVCAILRGEVTTVTPRLAAALAEALNTDTADLFVPAVSKIPGQPVEGSAA